MSRRGAESITHLFRWLETRYGGNVPMNRKAKILERSRALSFEDLSKLFSHEVTAIHVRDFYDRTAASRLGSELAGSVSNEAQNWKISTSAGLETSDVWTMGAHMPYNVAVASHAQTEYFDGVHKEFQNRRQPDQPLWPLDKLRLELEEVWPCGAGLARDKTSGRPLSGGLTRVMKGPTRWKKGFIHCDELGPLNRNKGMFSANVYLQMPKPQAMEIWPMDIRSRWDWYRNAVLLAGLSSQEAEAQMRLRKELGHPHIIEVEPGDLVLLCVQRPHSAIGIEEGTRISLQCFLQFNGDKERLLIEA
mmetsp:Transcript_17444/g.25195  ORF Transcript_17444/g.25195 Transcript_17444/m.25195 type:complete len:305 (+) Transcript_17444:47-961(+)